MIVAHVDDQSRWRTYRALLDGDLDPRSEVEKRLARMLFYSVFPDAGGFDSVSDGLKAIRSEAVAEEMRQVIDIAFDGARRTTFGLGRFVPALADVPLELHASYSREELLSALDFVSLRRTPSTMREGVAWCDDVQSDAFLITLKKSDRCEI